MFAVNLPLKLFPSTVANTDTGSLKSLHTFLKMFITHASEFEQNRTVQTIGDVELFDKKTVFFKTIFDKALTPFCKTFLKLKQLFKRVLDKYNIIPNLFPKKVGIFISL